VAIQDVRSSNASAGGGRGLGGDVEPVCRGGRLGRIGAGPARTVEGWRHPAARAGRLGSSRASSPDEGGPGGFRMYRLEIKQVGPHGAVLSVAATAQLAVKRSYGGRVLSGSLPMRRPAGAISEGSLSVFFQSAGP